MKNRCSTFSVSKPYSTLAMLFFFLLPFVTVQAQSDFVDAVEKERNENLKKLLDLRFRGGSGEFERQLLASVQYTDYARRQCLVGVVILSFSISCDNTMSDFRMRNPLHHGLNEQLTAFFRSTEGHWNRCTDERYTRFEIPVAFTIEGVKTNGRGFYTIEEESSGYRCRDDQYYIERLERFRERGRTKRAIGMVDVLIRRNPFNTEYVEIKRALLSGE